MLVCLFTHLEKVMFPEGCEARHLWIWKGWDTGAVLVLRGPGTLGVSFRGLLNRLQGSCLVFWKQTGCQWYWDYQKLFFFNVTWSAILLKSLFVCFFVFFLSAIQLNHQFCTFPFLTLIPPTITPCVAHVSCCRKLHDQPNVLLFY